MKSLHGLDSVKAASIGYLNIYSNASLSSCDAESICDFLSSPLASADISNNAGGCNSREEVLATCANSIHDESHVAEIQISPNPFRDHCFFKVKIHRPSYIKLFIINGLGQQITGVMEGYYSPGAYQNVWDSTGYPSGIYYCCFVSDFNQTSLRLVKSGD